WNLRGFGNPETRLALKNFCLSNKPDMVFLAEPMIEISQVPTWYWQSLKFDKFCVNNRAPHIPNLWGLWSANVSLVPVFVSSQCIAFEYSFNNAKVYVAAVYAHTSYLIRRQLWADLTSLQSHYVGSWMFVGDFNAVLGAHEKRGKRLPSSLSCNDFLLWTNANLLFHLNTIGVRFTWANGRGGSEFITQRLDRSIVNQAWLDFWQNIHCCALFKHNSDHHPLLVTQDLLVIKHPTPFRFYRAWTSHVDCARVVTEVWSQPVQGPPMVCLQDKLKRLRAALKEWNRSVFGNIDHNVKLAIEEVSSVQALIDANDFSAALQQRDFEAQLQLSKVLMQQEMFWRDKARVDNFALG
ncbi:hypothetical protein TSUD_420660, partial [Trifolium subterraneum]